MSEDWQSIKPKVRSVIQLQQRHQESYHQSHPMAKGAKKKTKWVSLSLASTTTTTVPPTEQDTASKSYRGTKKSTYGHDSAVNSDKSPYSENAPTNISSVERKSSWNSNGYSRRLSTDGNNGQNYSNGYQTHPSRNYPAHFKSHYNKSSYYHNGSRRPHYNSYNDRNKSNNANESKSEQNGAVIINEEEYTKITTPRQDVLFKKGYLSRPKTYTTTSTNANENGTATGSSSVNGTTDGSDVATGSGTVSTAESVTSDSTYLTDGHLLDYPAPLPYFGYIDQSGVLVMNGFAVDNSGFSYMNGGQTYIYPPNYHCQSSFNEDGQIENADESEPAVSGGDQNQSTDTLDGVLEAEAVANALNTVDTNTRLNSISEETAEGLLNESDSADLNQQVPQQTMLPPLENSFDYAQFYNAFYYPGCMMTPFPVVGDETYYDQFGGVGEEEQARQQSFRKRKKRYRNWEEYPPTFYPDATIDTMYQYPDVLCTSENDLIIPTEVPLDGIIPEPNSNDRMVPIIPPTTENVDTTKQPTTELPSSHQTEQNGSPSRSPKSSNTQTVEARSHTSTVSQASGKPRSHVQKTRKKDLIEMTRAFAEQNIDLTRPASLYKSPEVQKSEATEWRTVRNGKEITIEDDRERSSVGVKNTPKKNKEESEVSSEKLFFDDCKPEQTVVAEVSDDTKRGKKETTARKGKKTAKGKGKKQKKVGLFNHHTGFEVIEPEFSVVSEPLIKKNEFPETINVNEEELADCNENSDETNTEEQDTNHVEHEEVQNLILNDDESASLTLNIENDMDDDEECLENDLRDIQLSDLQIEACDREGEDCQQVEEEVNDPDSKKNENLEISEELIVQNLTPNYLENVEAHENYELHEKPSDSLVGNVMEDFENNHACAEEMDLIKKKLTVNCNLPIKPVEIISEVHLQEYELDVDRAEQKCKHFSNEEDSEDFDSGVQSPAAFTTSSSDSKDRKSSSGSIGSQDIHLTDAVTKWLSETLSNKRLEEMFVLPEDPLLLHRIHQFNLLNFDDSLVLSSDTYSSSSGDEADESVDSDYMSDVQAKYRELNGGPESHQKTELKKDQLAKQTANGHRLVNGDDHSNHKQKRCIIM